MSARLVPQRAVEPNSYHRERSSHITVCTLLVVNMTHLMFLLNVTGSGVKSQSGLCLMADAPCWMRSGRQGEPGQVSVLHKWLMQQYLAAVNCPSSVHSHEAAWGVVQLQREDGTGVARAASVSITCMAFRLGIMLCTHISA